MANVKFTDLANLGNITANTIVPVVESNTNYTVTAANLRAFSNSTTGNIVAGNITATGNITGSYIIGNGSQLTGLPAGYSNANVAAYLPTYSGTITANVVSATGNVTGLYFIGDGSFLTGLPASYGNANVAAYLPTYSGNLNPGTISATGNVTGAFIKGDGSQLTNLPVTYTNSNVTALLSNFGSNSIATSGNVQAAFFVGNGSQLTNLPAGVLAGNLTGNITGNGFGILNASTITSTGLISTTGNVSAGNIIGNLYGPGGNITGIPTSIVAGNGISVSASTGVVTITNNNPTAYGNANVATFLANYGSNTISTTGNITAGNLRSTGTISATGNVTISGTTSLGPYIETTTTGLNTSAGFFIPTMSNGPVQRATCTLNFNLNAPTGMVTGQSITIIFVQDATGGRVMTPNAAYRFAYGVKTLSTAANAIDVLSIFYDGTNYLCNLVKGYTA